MGKKCYVLNCPTGRKSCNEKFSIFKAPNDKDLLEEWRKHVPQKAKLLTSNDHICEKHFDKHYVISRWQPSKHSDFFHDHIRSKLKPNAVPTIFKNIEPDDPRIFKYIPDPEKKNPCPQLANKSPQLTNKLNSDYCSNKSCQDNAEVSNSDFIPICFLCLLGTCECHFLQPVS
ncbi:THAP-type domain-containing protein [Trichonephila clavata]|uniref:THAP-type domain-containing protein n=1 Tax=Trichonephila clavata TaxID=2740835 RepID=A0A8X6HSZ3_TRICU|nr:THAP-type domain-containing protein [Trichonephila clavata]